MYFHCHFAECEAKFDANPLLPHTTHFSQLVQSQNSTTMSQKCTEKKKHTSTHRMLLGRLVHKGYSLQYVVSCNSTASGFCMAFQFQGLLGSTLSIPGALLVTYHRWYHTVCCHKIHIYYTHFIRDFGGIMAAADYIITYLKGLNKTTITSKETSGLLSCQVPYCCSIPALYVKW